MALLLLCVCLKRKHPKAASHLLVTKTLIPLEGEKEHQTSSLQGGKVFFKIVNHSRQHFQQVPSESLGRVGFLDEQTAHPSGQCAHPKRC